MIKLVYQVGIGAREILFRNCFFSNEVRIWIRFYNFFKFLNVFRQGYLLINRRSLAFNLQCLWGIKKSRQSFLTVVHLIMSLFAKCSSLTLVDGEIGLKRNRTGRIRTSFQDWTNQDWSKQDYCWQLIIASSISPNEQSYFYYPVVLFLPVLGLSYFIRHQVWYPRRIC